MRILIIAVILFIGLLNVIEVTTKEARTNNIKIRSKNNDFKKQSEMENMRERSRNGKIKKDKNVGISPEAKNKRKKRDSLYEDEILKKNAKKWQRSESSSKMNERIDCSKKLESSKCGLKKLSKKVHSESRRQNCEGNCEQSMQCRNTYKWVEDKNKRSIKLQEADSQPEEEMPNLSYENGDEETSQNENEFDNEEIDICPKCRVCEDDSEADAETEENL